MEKSLNSHIVNSKEEAPKAPWGMISEHGAPINVVFLVD